MERLTYVFPAAAIIFLLLIFSEFAPSLRFAAVPFPKEDFRWKRADTVCVLAVTLVYTAVAFLGLGDSKGVESFAIFRERGSYAVVELPEGTSIGKLRYYSGLYMGDYFLQFSDDGENYRDICTMPQGHADVFKWNETELAGLDTYDGTPVRYLRLISGSQLWMGELAIYDSAGRLLPAENLRFEAGTQPLFDEQGLIPAEYSYKNSTYFDEIYHARTAYEHIRNIEPYEISHPPLGKLILGIGIRLFGMTPFGWRFSGTLVGVLMLPALYFFLKKMFGGTRIPCCCSAVFAFDFMHYVQTRIATIDSYAVFFIILMYLFFWLYWQADRTRLREWLPPLALSGVCFGLGAASKWICIYAGAGLGLLWLLDRIYRWIFLRREGKTMACLRETAVNILWCLLFFVLVPAAIYYVSYWPYGTARGMHGVGMLFSGDYARIVLDNQTYMFRYHSGVDATHPYSSVWWQWILDIRPILYYLEYPTDGVHVSFAAWVNPMLCWGGLLAMPCLFWRAIRFRDRTALFLAVGYLAQLLPWVFVTRVVFEYHYFPSTVFLLLGLGYLFREAELRQPERRWPLYSFTVVAVGLFFLFYPALRGLPVSGWFGTRFLRWLPSWPL